MSRLSLAVASVVLAAMLAPSAAPGQTSEAPSSPRTAWGDPDLQGIWNNATLTPLQRPANLRDQAFWTEEEAAGLSQQTVNRNAELLNAPARLAEAGGNVGAYNNFWMERGTSVVPTRRTSIIVDPEDGRLPPLTPEADSRMNSPEARRLARMRGGQLPVETWEQLDLGDRCLWYRGIPSFPTGYNNNYHIVQTPGMVAILQEHIHDTRFVPLDGRPHVTQKIRQFAGDSRGRWEGGHPRGGDHQLQRARVHSELQRQPQHRSARRRALHPARSRYARLRVHGERSEHLDAPVARIAADVAYRGADVRVRLSRGELRP